MDEMIRFYAMFDDPIRVTVRGMGEGQLIAIGSTAVVIIGDGSFVNVGLDLITSSWRYDVERDRWHDLNNPEPVEG